MRFSFSWPVVALVAVLPFAGSAGGFGCTPSTPSSPEQCAAMSSVSARDECYLVVAPSVFKVNPDAGIALVETNITDPLTRDMAWYNITRTVDPHSPRYCDKMQDQTLAERCRNIVRRPHLHRGLTGHTNGSPAGNAPGGPPGGGPPGGGHPGGGAPPAPKAP